MSKVAVEILSSLKQIRASQWDAVANPNAEKFNPFISHAFLSALENSGSATERTGWAAQHVILRENETITCAVPCYRKIHSMGEYVFDHGWADAFARAGGHYYPKLQVSVPFSPVLAPKLLGQNLMPQNLVEFCHDSNCSSVHITFTAQSDQTILRQAGWLERNDLQFHWTNAGYKTFDDFLAALSSGKRKNIRKERQSIVSNGVTFETLSGEDLHPHHWDAFWTFYQDTSNRKWGQPYLTRAFFEQLHDTMRQHVLLVLAYHGAKPIAGALNMIGGDTLYGRNWGCVENIPFLHFECCYYQAIDWAIAHGYKTIEAGAQGEHKLARGYVPVKTSSFHYLAHEGLRRAVAEYLKHERAEIENGRAALAAHAPFRHVESE